MDKAIFSSLLLFLIGYISLFFFPSGAGSNIPLFVQNRKFDPKEDKICDRSCPKVCEENNTNFVPDLSPIPGQIVYNFVDNVDN